VLVNEVQAPSPIAAGTPRSGLDQDLDVAGGGNAEQPETEQPTKLARARIALPPSPGAHAHGKPDLVARRGPIDGLKHELKAELEFQLRNDHERRLLATQGDEVAAADFTLDVEAASLEESLHWPV
jgi:hypothetical protein